MVRGKAALLVAASLLIAGCLAAPRWSDEVALDAPREGGSGPRTIDVEVSGADGPLPASVILLWFHNEDTWQEDGVAKLRLLGLRSNDGHVRGHVPADRDIYIVAGARGHTEEWTPVPLPASTEAATHQVRLYNLMQTVTLEGTWDGVAFGHPEVAPYLGGDVAWSPQPLRFDDDEASNEAIVTRLVDLQGALLWENTPTHMGDLGLMLASDEQGEYCRFHDEQNEVTPGPQIQRFEIPYESPCAFAFFDVGLPEPPIFIGPGTQTYKAAVLAGLPYQIPLEGRLVDSWGWQPLDEALGNTTIDRTWVDPKAERSDSGDVEGDALHAEEDDATANPRPAPVDREELREEGQPAAENGTASAPQAPAQRSSALWLPVLAALLLGTAWRHRR